MCTQVHYWTCKYHSSKSSGGAAHCRLLAHCVMSCMQTSLPWCITYTSRDASLVPPMMHHLYIYLPWPRCITCTSHDASLIPPMMHHLYTSCGHDASLVPPMMHHLYLPWCITCTAVWQFTEDIKPLLPRPQYAGWILLLTAHVGKGLINRTPMDADNFLVFKISVDQIISCLMQCNCVARPCALREKWPWRGYL